MEALQHMREANYTLIANSLLAKNHDWTTLKSMAMRGIGIPFGSTPLTIFSQSFVTLSSYDLLASTHLMSIACNRPLHKHQGCKQASHAQTPTARSTRKDQLEFSSKQPKFS